MRLLAILAVVLLSSTALSGCFGGDDEQPPATTTPTPTGGTPALTPTPTGTTGGNGTGTDANNTGGSTAPKAPKELFNQTKNFAPSGAPAPPAADAITVDAGYKEIVLRVTFSPAASAPAPVGQGPGIHDGISVTVAGLTCAATTPAVTVQATCEQKGPATPGATEITYAGNGAVTALVVVIEQ